jgi:hypothetical protein
VMRLWLQASAINTRSPADSPAAASTCSSMRAQGHRHSMHSEHDVEWRWRGFKQNFEHAIQTVWHAHLHALHKQRQIACTLTVDHSDAVGCDWQQWLTSVVQSPRVHDVYCLLCTVERMCVRTCMCVCTCARLSILLVHACKCRGVPGYSKSMLRPCSVLF